MSTWRCGHAASSVGSSSSGSNSAPVGLEDGGNVLNMFTANWKRRSENSIENVYSTIKRKLPLVVLITWGHG